MDEIVFIVNSFHPLAVQKSVTLSELKEESFILPGPSAGLYSNFVNACRENGFEPKIIYHCSQIETNVGLVQENIGVGVLSSQVAQSYKDKIAILRVVPPVIRKISLAVPKRTNHSPAVNVFTKFALQWIASR